MAHKSKSEMKFERVMREFANGKLTSHGEKVTDISVARAIAFSEARKINPEYGMKSEGGIIYVIKDKEAGNVIDEFPTLEKAQKELQKFEDSDKKEGIYKPDFYEITPKYSNIKQKSEGEKLDDIYRTGTAQQLWNAWDPKERQHFLTDHLDMFRLDLGDNPNEYIPKLAEASWNMLPKEVRKEVVIHHAMGIYHEGGNISSIPKLNKNSTWKDVRNYLLWLRDSPYKYHIDDDPFDIETFTSAEQKILKNNSDIMWKHSIDGSRGTNLWKVYSTEKSSEGGRITLAKKKMQDRIAVLKRTMVSANRTAQKSIQKKIDVLQAKLDYNPSLKEKIAAQKGRFYLDVPTDYAKRIYRQLWRQGIKPRLHKLNGNTKVVVDHATKLNKAYKIYSDILKEKSIPVPALSKIKGKL